MIERAHRACQHKLHPDKIKSNTTTDQLLKQINTAASILKDDVLRHEYNWSMNLIPHNTANRILLTQLHNRRADIQLINYESIFDQVRRREIECNGLVILDARYGDIDYISDLLYCMIDSGNEYGTVTKPYGIPRAPYRDVTVPVQCMVQSSYLVIPARSKLELEGFAEPIDGNDIEYNMQYRNGESPVLGLWILYQYNGSIYCCAVEDNADVGLPSDEHKLYYNNIAIQQWKIIQSSQSRVEIKKSIQRKRITTLLAGATLSLVSYFIYNKWQRSKHPEQFVNQQQLFGVYPVPFAVTNLVNKVNDTTKSFDAKPNNTNATTVTNSIKPKSTRVSAVK